jgi:5'-methylthioadenosine phosphorylase
VSRDRDELNLEDHMRVGVISQTAGPEVVLAGEAELPMALVGFVTDYANGVAAEPEPVEALLERMAASTQVFTTLIEAALPRLKEVEPTGVVYRFIS